MVNIDNAKHDPARVFKKPADVLEDASLSRPQKIDILRRWAYDEREKAVAEEENMTHTGPDKDNILDEILLCLLKLGVDKDEDSPPPTKHG